MDESPLVRTRFLFSTKRASLPARVKHPVRMEGGPVGGFAFREGERNQRAEQAGRRRSGRGEPHLAGERTKAGVLLGKHEQLVAPVTARRAPAKKAISGL